jgi:ATP-dependent protease ClpP protease subunit
MTFREENALKRWNCERASLAPVALRTSFEKSAHRFTRIGKTLLISGHITFVSDLAGIEADCRGVESLHLNSIGGCAQTGLRLYHALQGVTVATITKHCLSAAVLPAMAAGKIRIERGAQMMLHSPTLCIIGDGPQLLAGASDISFLAEQMVKIISARTKQPEAIVREWCEGPDRYFSSSECVSLGLADEIFDDLPEHRNEQPAIQSDLDRVVEALRTLGRVTCDKAALARELNAWIATVHHMPAPGFACFSEGGPISKL